MIRWACVKVALSNLEQRLETNQHNHSEGRKHRGREADHSRAVVFECRTVQRLC
nr:MAG TPA: hypothetical protein [Caudoviricetes sp.]